ncbi:hemolysin family protein [Ekhidna sp.]|uniref:hemolysin family protein n=1 Tax=Ekhidna sp. TaxID=2608089 RepID=UPI003B50C6D8
MEAEPSYTMDGIKIGLTVIFIILNGFFVAAEFALVKLTKSKIKKMMREKQPFASTAMWLYKRQNLALSACQLGITMASLALGWIGEPAIAHLITPLIHDLGVNSENLIHGIAFTIAFTTITAFHIVIGEQVPKIYAIRKPEPVFLGSALLLKGFYMVLYPFMYVLNSITNVILKWLGIDESDEHDTPLSEEEIRASLSIAYAKGELSKNEHRLLNAVFRFDDTVAKQIMKPRNEVEFLDANDSFIKNLEFSRASRHTRFPLCDDSLDKVLGVVHIKDIVGYSQNDNVNLKAVARSPMMVPENILLSKLLQEFRNARQHLSFVQDEYGTVLGIVTLEDLLEELVGSMQDEFDVEESEIVEQKDGKIIVNGDVQIDELNDRFKLNLSADDADTISGLIVEKVGHKLEINKALELDEGVTAEILAIDGIRAIKVRLEIQNEPKDTN